MPVGFLPGGATSVLPRALGLPRDPEAAARRIAASLAPGGDGTLITQAVVATIAVFGVMLALYRFRIIKVTDKLRSGIMVATGAVMVVYLASLVLRLFGADVPFIHETGTVGILISLAIVGVAAANLLLDFDMVERGAA